MIATMFIDARGNWKVTLLAETPSEKAMLDAIRVGYGVAVESAKEGDAVLITGGKP